MGVQKYLRIRNRAVREMLAEFIGTFILVTFVIASSAQNVLSKGAMSGPLTVSFAGGMGLVFGIYWSGAVSGGSLNPAVTFGLCLQGKIQWWKLPLYTIAELAGAFVAACVQYGVFYDAINAFDGGKRYTYGVNATAGIFSTFPRDGISTTNCFVDQVFGTFILMGCILAVTDDRNMKPGKGSIPLVLGGIVFAIGTCWAYNCGSAINPARDLGPRIFTAIAGWGVEPFSYRNYNWFWVPLTGPVVGALVAWVVYGGLICLHWPDNPSEENAVDLRLELDVPKANGDLNTEGTVNLAFAHDISATSDGKNPGGTKM